MMCEGSPQGRQTSFVLANGDSEIISVFPIFLPIFAPYNPYIPGCVFEFEFIDNAKCMHGNYYCTSAAHGAPMKVAIAAEKDKAQN